MLLADPASVTDVDNRMRLRIQAADYDTWRTKVTAVNGCAQPVRLTGALEIHDKATGDVLHRHGGDVFVPCGNRRASICPACSDRYAADAYHLLSAGLAGGAKGIPETVTSHPRAFVTVTAPSFGPVHSAGHTPTGRRRRCRCGESHHEADTRVGTPLDPDTYDYTASVLWQAHAGPLWARFIQRIRRTLARIAHIPAREINNHLRISYGKVAEYQRRGLIHFHAVMRLDGPDGPLTAPPAWATPEMLDEAIRAAHAESAVTTCYPDGLVLDIRWGPQLDIRRINQHVAAEVEDDDGRISETRLAGYIAKYATKGTGKTEAADRPIRSQLAIDHLRGISTHHRRIVQTCWDLGDTDRHPQYGELNLRRWAHMLGFRGHFLSKSRAYSTTFKQIRGDRQTFRLAETLTAQGIPDDDTTVVVNSWTWIGAGYRDQAERELAAGIADRIRADRLNRYQAEHDQRTTP
jgi:replication initiator protein RepSA